MENVNLLKLLSSKGFIQYSKTIAKITGSVHAAILFGELCSVANMFDFQEFYFSQEDISEDTALSVKQIRKALDILTELDLVSVKRKGVPCKNWYTLNANKLAEVLTGSAENEHLDRQKGNCQLGKNGTSSEVKKSQQLKDNIKDITKDINQKILISSETQEFESLSNDSTSENFTSENYLNDESLDSENVQDSLSLDNSISEITNNSVFEDTQRKKKSPAKKKESDTFPKAAYDEVFKTYRENRRKLHEKHLVLVSESDYVIAPRSAMAMIKKSFKDYGVDKVIQAVKDSIHYGWLYQGGNDYPFPTIFSSSIMTNLINKSWRAVNSSTKQKVSPMAISGTVIASADDFISDVF